MLPQIDPTQPQSGREFCKVIPARTLSFAKKHRLSVRGQEGAVLLLVLWVLIAMSLLGISFSAAVRTEVNAARNVVDQKRCFYLARAGVQYAVYEILKSQSAFAEVQRLREEGLEGDQESLPSQLQLDLGGGTVEVEILDESGKINLNVPTEGPESEYFADLVYNLLIVTGVSPPEADAITDSILDWLDIDDNPRPSGAESNYYLGLENPYRAKNDLFDVPEELLLVKGITPELYYGRKGVTESGEKVEFYGLQKFFTTFVRGTQINVNSAPLAVLAALPSLDYQTATRIYEAREEAPFRDNTDLMERVPGLTTDIASVVTTGEGNPILGGRGLFSIVSRGRLPESRVVSRIRCVIRLNPLSRTGYSVLYWNEADTEI